MKINIKIKHIIIIVLIFGLFWCSNLYLDIKNANNIKIVKIEFETDETTFNNINAFRISPSDFISPLIKDNDYKAFYSEQWTYLKKIKIEIPEKNIKNINKVKINIGKREFLFSKEQLLNEWEIKKANNIISLFSPDSVRFSKSCLPYLKLIINWPGDFNVLIGSFILPFFYFLIIIVSYYFLRKKIIDNHIFIYWFVFSGIIFFALIQRLVLNPLPYTGGDGWGYIGPAVTWFDTGKFIHIEGRSFPYPLFLLGILSIFSDFTYISIIQHLIGILTGVILLFVWKEMTSRLSIYKEYKIYFEFSGLILMGLYLFFPSPIVLEHHLRPEAIYPLFLVLHAFFIFKFLVSIQEKSKKTWLYGLLFFINNYFLYVFQPRWGLAVFANILIYFICFFIIKMKFFKKTLLILIIPIVSSFLLIYIPDNVLIKNESAQDVFLYGTLFWAHSKIIDKELEKDINDSSFTKYNKEMLGEIRNYMQNAFNQPKSKHKYLGFYFNRLFHDKPNAYLNSKLSKEEYKEFCLYYFKKAVINHPLEYAKKVLLELSQFYNFNGGMYSHRDYKVDREIYNDGYHYLNYNKANYIPYRSYMDSLKYLRLSYYDFNEIRFPGMELIYLLLSRTYIFVFLIFFILFIMQLIKVFKEKSYSFEFIFGIIIFIIFLNNFFITLTSAMIYCLDVGRYIDDQFLFVLFSNILAISYIFRKLLNLSSLKQ